MRTVFVGASGVSIATAKSLIKNGHEVIIIETNKEKIDALSDELDCSFLQGDGSRPEVLKEVDPTSTDVLFCLTNEDQDNVIASLVGRSLGFKRVVTRIEDAEFEGICRELGLKDVIIPNLTISRFLQDMVAGAENVELSTVLKDEARFFTFIVGEEDAGPLPELALPDEARIICLYRNNRFQFPGTDSRLRKYDEVVILTHSRNLPELPKLLSGEA